VDAKQYADFINHIQLAWCAFSVGTAQAVLDYVIEYCNNREAFGEPITHRQAVAFMIANIKIELESMRVLTQRAVSKAEQGLDFGKEAYLANVLCKEKAMEIANNGVQLLGGYGFCRDYPVERWYRDMRAVAIQHNGMHL
jgi:alkylation response protein AidB-like acyl-CoA dehydrogenase